MTERKRDVECESALRLTQATDENTILGIKLSAFRGKILKQMRLNITLCLQYIALLLSYSKTPSVKQCASEVQNELGEMLSS